MGPELGTKRRKIRDEGDVGSGKERRRKKKLKIPTRTKKILKGKRPLKKSSLTIVNAENGADNEAILPLPKIKQENEEFMEVEDTSPVGSEESAEAMSGDNNGEIEDGDREEEQQTETDADADGEGEGEGSEPAQKDSDDEDGESENGENDNERKESENGENDNEEKESENGENDNEGKEIQDCEKGVAAVKAEPE
jgi:cobalamin biosynthesis protein CobT